MSDVNKGTGQKLEIEPSQPQVVFGIASNSRRRLIKLGAAGVPVVATLVSQPALAWHCNSPSAWGSAVANPNTSTNARNTRNQIVDETWRVLNWRDNTDRSAVGTTSLPWNVLAGKYPGLVTGNKSLVGGVWVFDYLKVSISELVAATTIHAAGATTTTMVKAVLTSGTELQRRAIVAQLNFLCLPVLAQCITLQELKNMAQYGAAGTYAPGGLPGNWSTAKVNQYLVGNYMAVD
jgi:hypothetical protein